MRNYLLFILFFVSKISVIGQSYTSEQYAYDSLLNLNYGQSTDYAGNIQNLLLDIYKPKNNFCNRPIIILVHGGSWIGGSKNDVDIVSLARSFAKRGYVAAAINYRLGTHKAPNYDMYALCNTSISAPCAYISDSSEVYRAIFRGMQDTKGAVRFMKNRFEVDSTDFSNVYLIGQSAGAFNVLAASFLNEPSEKPLNCGLIGNAPSPDPDLSNCNQTQLSFTRPDLGSIEGELNLSGFTSEVHGVAAIYGGLLDLELLNNENPSFPVYLYHQGSDIIVHYNYGRILGRTSYECYAPVNMCQPYYFYPYASGSKAIAQRLLTSGWNSNFLTTSIIENYEYQNDCFDNGHSVPDLFNQAQLIANLFAYSIDQNENTPTVNCSSENTEISNQELLLAPNPTDESAYIFGLNEITNYEVVDIHGNLVISDKSSGKIDLIKLEKGMYIIRFPYYNKQLRFIKN